MTTDTLSEYSIREPKGAKRTRAIFCQAVQTSLYILCHEDHEGRGGFPQQTMLDWVWSDWPMVNGASRP